MAAEDKPDLALAHTAMPGTESTPLAGWLGSPEVKQARASVKEKLFGGAPEPVKIDRFLIVRRLGGGGMGVVYAAYDPKLDRKIAIKLLRRGVDESGADELQARLYREAQAMAKVNHPNVITVHEVGTHEGQVFVAMEFVDGKTLSAWLAAKDRRWAEIRDVFLAIGRGLTAAHAVGLVHRDFKPENVMIASAREGAARRVLVLDFGLAKTVDQAAAEPNPAGATAQPAIASDAMTQTGVVLGTPAYMAPEQHQARKVDERADQFSYCVALFEALYGRRPFVGNTYEALAAAVIEGELEEPAERGEVPVRAYRAMLRGLRPEPSDRFDAMAPLLEEIAYDPAVLRRRASAWIVASGFAVGLLGAVWAFDEGDPACAKAGDVLSQAWDTNRQGAVKAAFTATDKPYATEAYNAVDERLGRYQVEWEDAAAQICDADDEADSRRLERVLCLEWRAQEAAALTRLFAIADGDVVERAVEAATALTPPGVCEGDEALQASAPLPSDEALRANVVQARADLAHAKGLGGAGKVDDAIAAARSVQGSDAAAAYPPLLADTALLLGRLHRGAGALDEAEAELSRALHAGLAGEHDGVALAATVELVWVVGHERARFEDGERWLSLGHALASRRGLGGLALDLDIARGAMFLAAGRRPEARADFERAVQRAKQTQRDPVEPLLWLGRTRAAAGDFEGGLATLDEALTASRPEGAGADLTTAVHVELGHLHWRRGAYDEAVADFEAALKIEEAARGREHPAVAAPLEGLARAHWARGRSDDALAFLDRIAAIDASGRVSDEVLIGALEVRAQVQLELGDPAAAERAIDRGLSVARRHGAEHPLSAFLLAARAAVRHEQGRDDEALRYLDQAQKLTAARLGPGDPRRLELTVAVGRVRLSKGETGGAHDLLVEADEALSACCDGHFRRGDAQFLLAQSLRERDREPGRALELASSAADHYDEAGRPADAKKARAFASEPD